MTASEALLDIRDLDIEIRTRDGSYNVVEDVSYRLMPRETLGIVGESGSGKSIHALALVGLLPAGTARVTRGRAMFAGRDLLTLSEPELRRIRGAEIGFIFQDPMMSLNPVLTIGRQLAEPMVRHLGLSHAKALDRAADLLGIVGIPDARRRLKQYPHEFSGGMRQRAMIAMALSCKPKLLIADEPTTALDVTVQAQIVDLVADLRAEFGMAVIWITHDMGVVAGLADTIQILYAGRIMERGPIDAVFANPRSAYTAGLLRSIPSPSSDRAMPLFQIQGQPPRPAERAKGDPFAPRNPHATARCFLEMPPLRAVSPETPEHLVAAWYDLPAVKGRGGMQ